MRSQCWIPPPIASDCLRRLD
jgi:hypothetical protein